MSTIDTYSSSPSIIEREQIIDEVDHVNEDQPMNNLNSLEQQTNEQIICETCSMLIQIVDQQAQQIRQYTEQISQQTDLLAKLARRFARIEQTINSDNTSEQQTIHSSTNN